MKAIILMLFVFIISSASILPMEFKLVKEVRIDQESCILRRTYRFAVTEDDFFILPDSRAGDIKIFNPEGRIEKIWGRKGMGPDEFYSPKYCD